MRYREYAKQNVPSRTDAAIWVVSDSKCPQNSNIYGCGRDKATAIERAMRYLGTDNVENYFCYPLTKEMI
jgi:hypothetical protein